MSGMRELSAGDLATGRCPACDRRVLTHVGWVDEDGSAVRLCVHCDRRVADELRRADLAELEGLGYGLIACAACDESAPCRGSASPASGGRCVPERGG